MATFKLPKLLKVKSPKALKKLSKISIPKPTSTKIAKKKKIIKTTLKSIINR